MENEGQETTEAATRLASGATDEEKRKAASVLGKIQTEKKLAAQRANVARIREMGIRVGKHLAPLSGIRCTCTAGDALEGHRWDCPRGQAIKRRKKEGKPLE